MVGENTAGALYLVSTPIGNLEDITMRAIRLLGEVDLIAAEDTRRAAILLRHYQISTPTVSYHAHNEHRRTEWLLDKVAGGERVAVLSDAGTPAIADPGFLIVRGAAARGIEPIVVPGVSALTHAATAAGVPMDAFSFHGFPPVKSGGRRRLLEEIRDGGRSAFLFESPHRMGKLLAEIAEVLGADNWVVVVREATKIHEEVLRGAVGDLAKQTEGRNWKGECVVVIARPGWQPPESIGDER